MFSGYIWPSSEKSSPPALIMKSDESKIVMAGLVEGHARMYEALKAQDTVDADGDGTSCLAGISYNIAAIRPKNAKLELDLEAAEKIFYLWNRVFLDTVVFGQFDSNLDGTQDYREDLGGRLDFLGLSYFSNAVVIGTQYPAFADFSELTTFDPLAFESLEDAKGFYEVLKYSHDNYHLPILVTGNGINDRDDGRAPKFMVEHLQWLLRALAEGVDIRGSVMPLEVIKDETGKAIALKCCECDMKGNAPVPR